MRCPTFYTFRKCGALHFTLSENAEPYILCFLGLLEPFILSKQYDFWGPTRFFRKCKCSAHVRIKCRRKGTNRSRSCAFLCLPELGLRRAGLIHQFPTVWCGSFKRLSVTSTRPLPCPCCRCRSTFAPRRRPAFPLGTSHRLASYL